MSRKIPTRRTFLGGLMAGGLLGARPPSASAEPPPETPRIALVRIPTICTAPQYVAEDLLRVEGFTEVHWVAKDNSTGIEEAVRTGEANLNSHYAAPACLRIEAGDPVVLLAGVHTGCFELFGHDRVRAIRDLKGKTVAVAGIGTSPHVFVSVMPPTSA
jgi:NitT/TauT family transport system substrate-binding protein